MSEWVETTLGEVMTLDIDAVGVSPAHVYGIVGVLNRGRGLLYREPLAGSGTAYKTLNRIKPNHVIYSRLKAFEGAITVAPEELPEVYASQEFPTFTCGPMLFPDYFRLLTTTTRLWDTLQNLSTGMGGRRERVKPKDFLTVKIALPPLPEQRRIIGVMAAVDAQIDALEAEIGAGKAARGPMMEALLAFEGNGWVDATLGDLGVFIRGRRFTKDEYVESGLGCIHYGQVHTRFGPVATTAVTFLPMESRSRLRLAEPGDVVVAATSENIEDLGKATVWLGHEDVAVHDDCYIFRHVLDPKFASYLFGSPGFQRQKVQYAAGTKVTRISGANLAKIRVPIPSADIQVKVGKALSEVDAHVDELRNELARVRALRSTLLTSLLIQETVMPESYDDLLMSRA